MPVYRIDSLNDPRPIAMHLREIMDSILARKGTQYAMLVQSLFSLNNLDNVTTDYQEQLVALGKLSKEDSQSVEDGRVYFMGIVCGLAVRAWLGLLDASHEHNKDSKLLFANMMQELDTDLNMLCDKQAEFHGRMGK